MAIHLRYVSGLQFGIFGNIRKQVGERTAYLYKLSNNRKITVTLYNKIIHNSEHNVDSTHLAWLYSQVDELYQDALDAMHGVWLPTAGTAILEFGVKTAERHSAFCGTTPECICTHPWRAPAEENSYYTN